MNVRRAVNAALRRSGYQVVKCSRSESTIELVPRQIIDDEFVSSRVAPERKHVWIVSPPKSGSTWFTELLSGLLEWPVVALNGGYGRREQEVDVRPLLRHAGGNILSPHQHCRASEPTLEFIERFRVTPIIQTRDIFDTVVSLRDHLVNESAAIPMAYVDDGFADLPDDRQFQFVIEMILPWYFNFYASWFRANQASATPLLFITYEELAQDTSGALKKTLEFLGECRTEAQIGQAIARAAAMNTRKNKGVSGRGDRMLTESHKARIRELRRYYPQADFSMIGI